MDTQTTATTEQIIRLMESGLGLTFSQEQKQILMNDFEKPLLVNACAGSGKTTIVILMILVAISKGLVDSSEVLGVTFSNRSRLDMDKRYDKYIKELSDVGLNMRDTQPLFSTFHALFLHLLMTNDEYKNIEVLQSPSYFTRQLKTKITHPSDVCSINETLNQIFTLNNYMINQDLTEDCIYPIGYGNMNDEEVFEALSQCTRQEHEIGFYQDYIEVVTYYQELKIQNGLVDFNDMKILLLQSMKDKKYLKQYQDVMKQFKLVIIDEFQDIDKLQWKIISKLLSSETMSRLVVVGDDDQSVYSFRGSNPKYIMNYCELMPNAQTLNLSTNYRTGGKILCAAIPGITLNSIRLEKSLQAFNSEKGTIFTYEPNNSEEYGILKHLAEQVNDSSIDNKEIAVLVRYNASRTIAADWLANHNIYANINNKSLVLQRNRYYKIIVETMRALWNDNYKYFYNQSSRIGFKKYTAHIDEVKKRYGKKRIVKLSKYLTLTQDSMNSLTSTELDEYGFEFDSAVIEEFNDIQNMKNEGPENAEIPVDLFISARRLTVRYFNFMTSRKFISIKELNKLFSYLAEELSMYKNPDDLFKHEDYKESILTKKEEVAKQQNQVQFLSLHQSKGLEFKYVYLYDLSDKEVHQGSLDINKFYRPDISFDNFVDIFSKRILFFRERTDKAFNSAMIEEYSDLVHEKSFDPRNFEESLNNKRVIQLMYNLYKAAKKYSAFIEEERRLLYVGVTRAKAELNVELIGNANPLLFELNLPKPRQN